MEYNLIVIGAGWAGLNAALKARELGQKVLLIDKGLIGGTCLNQGCVPTKALIQCAKAAGLAKKSCQFGVDIQDIRINFPKIQLRKNEIIKQLADGLKIKLKGIDFINIQARIISPKEVRAGESCIKTENIIIATGSAPLEIPGLGFDGQKVISSDDLLNIQEIPQSLLIVGGGVIGCEFASLFSSLGSTVTIAEKMPSLLPAEDSEVSKKLEQSFKKRGIKVHTNADAKTFDILAYEKVLLCVGRKPDTQGLAAQDPGLRLEKGKVLVNEYLQTNIASIFAAGDCTGKIMLAHYAAYQGEIAAYNSAHPDNMQPADNANIPNCIYTDPEIASVGLKEEEAKAKYDICLHKFDFMGSGMARIINETEGFIKAVSDKKSGKILGAAIIGPRATELISVFTLAIQSGLKVSDLRATVFAHPTISESIADAFKAHGA